MIVTRVILFSTLALFSFLVRQTTLDLQSLMLNFLSEMTFFGRNRNPRPSNQISVGRSAGAAGMAIDSVGECFVRVGNWGVFLEVSVSIYSEYNVSLSYSAFFTI